jgi:hypothetical protein
MAGQVRKQWWHFGMQFKQDFLTVDRPCFYHGFAVSRARTWITNSWFHLRAGGMGNRLVVLAAASGG